MSKSGVYSNICSRNNIISNFIKATNSAFWRLLPAKRDSSVHRWHANVIDFLKVDLKLDESEWRYSHKFSTKSRRDSIQILRWQNEPIEMCFVVYDGIPKYLLSTIFPFSRTFPSITTSLDNEEPAMRNLIIDGAAGGETKICHDVTFPLLTLHRGKYRVHFSTGFFQKENIVSTDVLPNFRTKNRWHILRTLLLMHDGVSFDKIQPKQVGYFGTWINWKQG
jgi:hypothetical protein